MDSVIQPLNNRGLDFWAVAGVDLGFLTFPKVFLARKRRKRRKSKIRAETRLLYFLMLLTLASCKLVICTVELQLLGVTIDSQMDFNNHISALCKRASQKIGVLMRLRNLIPTTAKLHLFKAAILPHLTYCHLAWHFCKASDTRKLERLQERGLRAVFKDNNLSYVNLLKRAKLPTLLNRRLQDLCILMYKVKHELCPSYIRNIFSRQSNTYNLRQSDFTLPRFNTVTHGKHSVRFLGPKLWSKLPKNNRDAESLNVFKKRMRDLNLSELIDDGCRGCGLCSS